MFSIFSPKEFLVDHLEGLVDIHNHILPGIDDGAKTIEDSIHLIKGLGEFGIQHFVATPHIMSNYYPNTPETIKVALNKVKNTLVSENLKDVSIAAAAEHMIDDNFESLLENKGVMPLRKNYLLVEMSYLQASINFDEAIQKIGEQRFFPILAHPERYLYLHKKQEKYKKYKEQGILFQLNLLSLGNFYGKDVNKMAFKLLEEGYFDYTASDIHNSNQITYLKEIKIAKKHLEALFPIIERTIDNFY